MRTKPYTEAGIRRLWCFVCGKAKGYAQWQICADGRQYRVVCKACDVELNGIVLKWAGFLDWRRMLDDYRKKVYGEKD